MNDPHADRDQNRLDAYLDGLLSPAEAAELEQEIQESPALRRELETQRTIDASLKRVFASTTPDEHDLAKLLPTSPVALQRSQRSSRGMVLLALAAAAVWVLVALWIPGEQTSVQPFFAARPLTEIYAETVKNGFKPYYYCEDDVRFAQTFAKRQHVPLGLSEMPDDRYMVGLSYSGGLSRETTAMLCRVQDQPVIVFVDRSVADSEIVRTNDGGTLHVHRQELGPLVIYEVGPYVEAQMLQYLRLLDAVPQPAMPVKSEPN